MGQGPPRPAVCIRSPRFRRPQRPRRQQHPRLAASFYSQYVTSPNYFLPQGSYTVPYGQPWPNATQVPLSSYSSLNGATTSSSTPQLQQQQSQPHQQSQQSPQQQQQSLQAHPSTSNHMIIDPNLTMNGAGSSSMQTSFSQPTSYGSQPQQQQQPRQQLQQQQQQQMQQQQSHPTSIATASAAAATI
ncbi:hypothetical protein BJ912DRAFT_428866 [Pholiota molesta]|nr:hypothetical protein BJ912DRAFT_428866 [Pholiota molesta]